MIRLKIPKQLSTSATVKMSRIRRHWKKKCDVTEKKKCQEIFNSADSIFSSQWVSYPAIWRWHKATVQTICAKFLEKQLCWDTFSVFLNLKGCNFIIKEVRRSCCPMTFEKFSRTVTQHICLAVSGGSAILAILIKTLRRDFLYYVYWYNYWTKIRKSRN